tara:strand:- start:48 stop:971 length:924 start_codon:yes stop_codon:yes gene_type:complete
MDTSNIISRNQGLLGDMSQDFDMSQSNHEWSNFNSNKFVSGTKDFLESNSIVAKFAFLLMIIIIFVIFLKLGTSVLGWLFSPSPDPILIDGMIDSRQMMIIPQDPSAKGAKPILRSVNDSQGLELTWSVWINVEDYTYRQGSYKHIFHKGNDDVNSEGLITPNNAPGLYLDKTENNLIVMMNTFDNHTEQIVVEDIPIQKWVNIVVRVIQHQVDVYINGTLAKRQILVGVPKQNYGDVYVSLNGGFSGHTSDLRYFNSGLGTAHILAIAEAGPNTHMVNKHRGIFGSDQNYLSTRWYLKGSNNMYNP